MDGKKEVTSEYQKLALLARAKTARAKMFPARLQLASAAARRASSTHRSPLAVTHIDSWIRTHEASFAPPVMNKLLHRDQLSIMFVGGPNEREDFHLEAGSEFFYQLRGNMQLPTVQAGERTVVTIREGEVYLLPSRIPHSPQRPERGSIGLVIERQRYEHEPPDGLRFYTDFEGAGRVPRPGESPLALRPTRATLAPSHPLGLAQAQSLPPAPNPTACEAVLWERYFHCKDLGKVSTSSGGSSSR
jgi:3-hydroxyanthranilate 3,4-dioxygenase